MDDLTATRLCAEAMGFIEDRVNGGWRIGNVEWNPLHDGAHAMALVKKLQLTIEPTLDLRARIVRTAPADGWLVELAPWGVVHRTYDSNLNRAIVYCAAQIQEAKHAR